MNIGFDALPELRRREQQREVGPIAILAGGIAAFAYMYIGIWFFLLVFGA